MKNESASMTQGGTLPAEPEVTTNEHGTVSFKFPKEQVGWVCPLCGSPVSPMLETCPICQRNGWNTPPAPPITWEPPKETIYPLKNTHEHVFVFKWPQSWDCNC